MTSEPDSHEEVLAGGNMTAVVRVGDTVRRAAGPWTPTIHAFLRHLRASGFDQVPEPLGIDERGREIISFLPGAPATGLRRPTSCLPSGAPECRRSGYGPPSTCCRVRSASTTPLASRRLYTDGAEVVYDYASGRRDEDLLELVAVRTGQTQFSELVRDYLQRVAYGDDGWAAQVELPIYRHARVTVDPDVRLS